MNTFRGEWLDWRSNHLTLTMNVDRLMTCSFFDFIRYISESVFRVVFRIFIADTGVKTRLEMGTI